MLSCSVTHLLSCLTTSIVGLSICLAVHAWLKVTCFRTAVCSHTIACIQVTSGAAAQPSQDWPCQFADDIQEDDAYLFDNEVSQEAEDADDLSPIPDFTYLGYAMEPASSSQLAAWDNAECMAELVQSPRMSEADFLSTARWAFHHCSAGTDQASQRQVVERLLHLMQQQTTQVNLLPTGLLSIQVGDDCNLSTVQASPSTFLCKSKSFASAVLLCNAIIHA